MNTNTILFLIACRTCLRLTPAEEKRVRRYIENVMNGDGLYQNASEEVILEAYHDQHNPFGNLTWLDLVKEIRLRFHGGSIRVVCQNTARTKRKH